MTDNVSGISACSDVKGNSDLLETHTVMQTFIWSIIEPDYIHTVTRNSSINVVKHMV